MEFSGFSRPSKTFTRMKNVFDILDILSTLPKRLQLVNKVISSGVNHYFFQYQIKL